LWNNNFMSDESAPPPPSSEQAPEQPQKPENPALGDSLEALAKKLFFVADGAGEPVLMDGGPHTIVLLWPDESMIRAHFEARPGRLKAVGPRAANEQEALDRNKAFDEAKKLEDERLAALRERTQAIVQNEEVRA
jgi:hypothetical protein